MKLKKLMVAGAAVIFVVGIGGKAEANGQGPQTITAATMGNYSCYDSNYGTTGTYWTSAAALGAARANYSGSANCVANHTSNSAGSVVTAVQTLRAATAQTVGIITQRISSQRSTAARPISVSLNGDGSSGNFGLSGGDKKRGIGLWVQGSYVGVEDDQTATAFDGNVITGMIGVDKKLAKDRLLLGLAAGYEVGDFDTQFNNGSIESSGFLVAPYLSFSVNKIISVDATVGYGLIEYENERKDSVTNESFKGDADADRIFGSVQVNAQKWFKKFRLGGKLGGSYTTEDRDGFTETGTTGTTVAVASTDTDLGQGLVGVNVAYDAGKVIPYLDLTGEFDFSKSDNVTVATTQTQPDDSDFGARLTLGADFRFSDRASAKIEGNYVFFRDDYTEWGGLAKIRIDF